MIEALATIRTARGIYFTLNPVNPILLTRAANQLCEAVKGKSTQDTDILRRRWLLLDIDPKRPTGISSTKAEVSAAMAVRNEIYHYLTARGWPKPVTAMSGNGVHLLYRIDLPAQDEGLVRRCLAALAKRFDTAEVQVDKSVYNPARICRLYGTRARKGTATNDRPHRLSKILGNPQRVEIVPAATLESLAAEADADKGAQEHVRQPTSSAPFDVPAFVRNHGLDVTGPERWNSTEGAGQRWIFRRSPMCEHHEGAAYIAQLGNGAVTAGCHHNSCTWTWEDLRSHCKGPRSKSAVSDAPRNQPGDGAKPPADALPQVRVPGGHVSVTKTAQKLGKLLGSTGRYFGRERTLTVMRRDDNQVPFLEIVNPSKFISVVEEVCQPVKPSGKGGLWEPTIFGRQTADSILSADALFDSLPPIKAITRCPILLERDGQLVEVAEYDRASGIYAGGQPVEQVSLQEAKEILWGLSFAFRFTDDPDRARAMAALITPALVFGGLLQGRAPATVIEADKSQAGKGYLAKVIAGVYADTPATVTQTRKGVGSLEEQFDKALLQGRAFISLDNVRGKFDSPKLESCLTEPQYYARVPFAGPVAVDPRKTIVLVTSNRAEFTEDFANRVSTIRLLKHPLNHVFTKYPEGDLLRHVQANCGRYLGAVFAIVKAWYKAGMPASAVTGHDFRAWCGPLDWIVTNLLGAAPLMEGHQEIQRRTVSPSLTWLRDVAHAVDAQERLREWLRSSAILEILHATPDAEIPGLKEDDDIGDEAVRDKVHKAIGRRLWECLGHEDEIVVDGYSVSRRTTPDEQYRKRTEYCFQTPQSPGSDPEVKPE